VRDNRGFAIKFYTKFGNYDIMALSEKVFPLRDPMKILDFTHAVKRNARTGLSDPNDFWDFISLSPETMHFVTNLFSTYIPDGFRHLNAFAINSYVWVNAAGERVFVKYHIISD